MNKIFYVIFGIFLFACGKGSQIETDCGIPTFEDAAIIIDDSDSGNVEDSGTIPVFQCAPNERAACVDTLSGVVQNESDFYITFNRYGNPYCRTTIDSVDQPAIGFEPDCVRISTLPTSCNADYQCNSHPNGNSCCVYRNSEDQFVGYFCLDTNLYDCGPN